MSIESLGQRLSSVPQETLKEAGTTLKNILTPPPYDRAAGPLNHAAKTAAETLAKLTITEPVRFAGAAIGGIMRTTVDAMQTVLGGAVKLTGKALLSLPIFPAPASHR